MNARGQRALARRNRCEGAEVVQEGPREEEILDSDTAGDCRGARCCSFTYSYSGGRSRVGPPAAVAIPAPIDPGMWLNMVNVKPRHLADLEVDSMKKFILDYKPYSQKCPRQMLRKMQQLN